MNHFDVENALKTATVLCDTREQDTIQARKRLKDIGLPIERKALPFGDYSIKTALPDGTLLSLEDSVAIERKMSCDEIIMCYTSQRPRFTREFLRAKDAGAKVYLLIENATIEKFYSGNYRSKVAPQAITASLFAWLARYNCQLIMCEARSSGKVIHDILYRELKERLESIEE